MSKTIITIAIALAFALIFALVAMVTPSTGQTIFRSSKRPSSGMMSIEPSSRR